MMTDLLVWIHIVHINYVKNPNNFLATRISVGDFLPHSRGVIRDVHTVNCDYDL